MYPAQRQPGISKTRKAFFPMKTKTNPDPNRLTISAIAQLLASTRKTIRSHLHRDGAPPRGKDGCYDRTLSLRFLRGSISKGGLSASALEQLRTRRLEIEIERADLELKKARKEVIALDALKEPFGLLIRELQAGLYDKFERELPGRLIGKGQVEITLMLTEACDALVHALKVGRYRAIVEHGGPAGGGKGGYG
jgi:hypothetical protein